MVKSLFTGVTGLKSHQQRMDMIGNNIANVNTIGYKTDVMTFADVYYQSKRNPSAPTATLGGINPRTVGYGVKVSSVEANLSQSGYNYTDSKTDIALDGKGFFQLMDGAGNIYYTRAGHFKFDPAGYLVNDDGYHVLGVSGECDDVAGSSDVIRAVIPTTTNNVSSATKNVNGTNVTVSVSAPSEFTNMSVTFSQADFPYASYANGVLTIFFDKEQQFDSQDAFDLEIKKALTAGGINLPDDVELTMDFDPIPDDIVSAAAHNTVDDFKFTTENSTVRFHISKPSSTGTGKVHGYIDFSVQDNTIKDNIKLDYKGENGAIRQADISYDSTNGWVIPIYGNTTAADINTALKEYLGSDDHAQFPKISCTAFTVPGDFSKRDDAVKAFCGQTIAGITNSDCPAAGLKFFGNPSSGGVTGKFDFAVKEKGEFANKYMIQFAKKSGYGDTTASWEENTLTINICADTTIADVNAAIRKASGGDDKRVITYYDITGLDYGEPRKTVDGQGTVRWEFALGYTYTCENNTVTPAIGAGWTDRNGNPVTDDDVQAAFGAGVTVPSPTATSAPGDLIISKKDANGADPDRVVWNVETRNKYFGGIPHMNPTGGKDAFFTETAKKLSTFNLTDGRLSEEQTMDEFTDYMIGSDGVIIGLHPIYGTMVIGRVDIATFDNPNGLQKVGGTNFMVTVASGPASVKKPGEDGAAMVVPNALEMSNVDLADEFTNMIATQRGYQANSRVVTVSDTMIEELLSLKR